MTVFGIGDSAQAELSEFWLDKWTKTIFLKATHQEIQSEKHWKKRSTKTRVSNGTGRTVKNIYFQSPI